MTGAVINFFAIIIGGVAGLLLKGKMNEEVSQSVMRAIGLCVCIIGISGALDGDIMLMVIAIALGIFAGELLRIDNRLNNFGLFIQKKFTKDATDSSFAQGFVNATLLFCVGAMAIVGSIDSGLRNDQSIIITKSLLDAVASMALASTFGAGVLFSAVAVLIYQGSIELFAGSLQNIVSDELVTQISAVGGIMILGIGVNMVLDKKEAKIKIANLLPGFIFAIAYFYLQTTMRMI